MVRRFDKISFGFASAEEESIQKPELLLQGFFDEEGIVDDVSIGSKFLVLGYKGSGKTAIAQHLRLRAEEDAEQFVKTTYLGDFPYNDFAQIVQGSAEPAARYPIAWSWLLLLSLFDSFASDVGASIQYDQEFRAALNALGAMGLLPDPDLKRVALITSKATFKLQIPKLLEANYERNRADSVRLPLFVDRLKAIAERFRSNSRHLLIIDGLDDILTGTPAQYETLAALVMEASRLNMLFQSKKVPAKIILLCRTDLYERLPSANKNKIRQDAAVELDWYHDPRDPTRSDLVRLANRRTRLTFPDCANVFQEFFPQFFAGRPIVHFLLDQTRHTPRDFLQLLRNIQKVSYGDGVLSENQVWSGIRAYSIHYYLPEIRDELAGYCGLDEANRALELLGAMNRKSFKHHEMEEFCRNSRRYAKLDVDLVLNLLFECSAIGNVDTRRDGNFSFTFKYRNRNATLRPHLEMRIQNGLWKALNV